ncbi:MAG TPA: M50 family metallopeptidase [Solirubrobacteraceae bacterium]|nr:M50 family metallopeptidase [Solirubrobacteraceae bacterium]
MSYLLAFLGFAALIVLHEAGHFAAAKAVGMRVERFSLFFGPLVVRRRWRETEYGIGVIPLGGYVKITGMNPNEPIAPADLPRAYYNRPVWARVVTILAGPAVNIAVAFLIAFGVLAASGQPIGRPTDEVGGVVASMPAAAYLRPGDRIVSVDGVGGSAEAIRHQIETHRCAGAQVPGCLAATPARVTVRRAGRLLTFEIRPRYTSGRPELGFYFAERVIGVVRPSVVGAASGAASWLWSVTTQTVGTIVRIFEPQERRQLSGAVGIYTVAQESFATSPTLALTVLALISLSLGVINLFPFLPLDGGHVFWALAEKIRGRRIPWRVMERAGVIGFAVIVLLFAIGLSNDISALTGSGLRIR